MSLPPSPPPASRETRQPLLLVVDIVLISLTFLVLCGRVYSRLRLLKRLESDDWCILAAGVCMAANVAILLVMRSYGLGLHMQFVKPAFLDKVYAMGQMRRVLYLPTVAFVRISILLFMRRLSPSRPIQWSAVSLIVWNIVISIIAVCLLAFGCSPARVFLTPTSQWPPGAKCATNAYLLELSIPILSAVLDFAVWLVPAFMIFGVRFLGWRQKVLKVMLLGLGLFACIPSALRIPNIDGMKDITYNGAILSLWMDVEIGVGITAASAPALYPLFAAMIRTSRTELGPKFRSWTQSTASEPNTARSEPGNPSADITLRGIQVGDHCHRGKVPIPRHSSVEHLNGDGDSSRGASTQGE